MKEPIKPGQVHPLDMALQASINGHPEISEDILRSLPQNDLGFPSTLGITGQKFLIMILTQY
jgi:hypothetical protein